MLRLTLALALLAGCAAPPPLDPPPMAAAAAGDSLSDAERWVWERGVWNAEFTIANARREHRYQTENGLVGVRRWESLHGRVASELSAAGAYFDTFARLRGIEEWSPDALDPHPLALPTTTLAGASAYSGGVERHVRLVAEDGDWAYVENGFGHLEESIAEVEAALGIARP